MANYNDEHSEEVHEIMGQQANWMVRWGAALLILIVAVVVGVFFLISYPVFLTVPFRMEAARTVVSNRGVTGEIIVSEVVYDQIKVGQEMRVMVAAAADPAVIGRVDGKLAGRRVRLVFPVKADQQRKIRTALQGAGSAKIKTGEKRLIFQLNGLFRPK